MWNQWKWCWWWCYSFLLLFLPFAFTPLPCIIVIMPSPMCVYLWPYLPFNDNANVSLDSLFPEMSPSPIYSIYCVSPTNPMTNVSQYFLSTPAMYTGLLYLPTFLLLYFSSSMDYSLDSDSSVCLPPVTCLDSCLCLVLLVLHCALLLVRSHFSLLSTLPSMYSTFPLLPPSPLPSFYFLLYTIFLLYILWICTQFHCLFVLCFWFFMPYVTCCAAFVFYAYAFALLVHGMHNTLCILYACIPGSLAFSCGPYWFMA